MAYGTGKENSQMIAVVENCGWDTPHPFACLLPAQAAEFSGKQTEIEVL
jgi:hypothetical protein